MSKILGLFVLMLGFSALPMASTAQGAGDGEGDGETMEVVEDENDLLSLPEQASDTAVEKSAFGLETANEARANGREFGESQAEAARENRGEAGEAGREKAAEARENAGHP